MLKTERINHRINLIVIPSDQYKTNLVSIYIKRPLNKQEVTKNAMLPYVLRAGSQNLDSQSKIAKALQELYGSSIGVGVSKVGERQILSYKLAYTREDYLGEPVEQKAIRLLFDLIFRPYVINGGFNENYANIEKDIHEEAILSKMNDKGSYAVERLKQIMCAEEPYGIPEDGTIEELHLINRINLYEHYLKIIHESEIDIVLAGKVDSTGIKQLLEEYELLGEKQIEKIAKEKILVTPNFVKEEIETMSIAQGKLVMGFRTNIGVEEDLYIPLTLYNMILGGSATSKLFTNIREKHSLCYSIGSSIDKMKSLLFIKAGIEVTDYSKVKELILNELENIKLGNITNEELANAKKLMINGIRSVKDSIWTVSDYIYSLMLQGDFVDPNEIIKKIDTVTIEDIRMVAEKIKLDAIYFLTNDERDMNEK